MSSGHHTGLKHGSATGVVPPVATARRPSPFPAGLLIVDLVAVVAATAVASSWSVFGAVYGLVVLLLVAGRPQERIDVGVAHDIPMLAGRSLLAFAAPVAFPMPHGFPRALGVQVVCTFGLLALSRGAFYYGVREARRRHRVHANTLVVGDGGTAAELVDAMRAHPEYGLHVVGLLGDEAVRVPGTLLRGPVHCLDEVLSEQPIDKVVVAFGRTPDAELVSVLRGVVHRDVDVYIVPRFFELGAVTSRTELDDLWGIPLQRVKRPAPRHRTWRYKRVLDVIVASTMLLLLSPVLAAIALVVKLSSPGPVLFRQRRLAQGGREFDILKFRTLRVASPEAAQSPVEVGATHLIQASRRQDVDNRQTRIGRILRATNADELPQLWNILRGDMSLVGPRPEEVRYARVFTEVVRGYHDRHRLPVGLTGWAQVHGLRGETSIAKRVCFDNNYIEHWSLWRDVVIIGRTFAEVFRQASPASGQGSLAARRAAARIDPTRQPDRAAARCEP
jgi:exopolysaccharide biosynthesis polyprenyl glycosylphosphotransferase